MYLTFLDHYIQLGNWPTRKALIDFLSTCGAGSILLGENSEHQVEFFSVEVKLGPDNTQSFGIGILSEGHGLKPNLFLLPRYSMLIFGYNQDVIGILIPDGNIRFSRQLDSLFYEFIPVAHKNIFLVVQEIGICALNFDGTQKWQYIKDVVTGTNLKEDTVMVNFMDGQTVRLDLATGTEMKGIY